MAEGSGFRVDSVEFAGIATITATIVVIVALVSALFVYAEGVFTQHFFFRAASAGCDMIQALV